MRPSEDMCSVYSLEDQELGEEEESWQTAARAEAHWDEAGTDGEESEEDLEITEGEDNVEFDGNSGLHYSMTPTS